MGLSKSSKKETPQNSKDLWNFEFYDVVELHILDIRPLIAYDLCQFTEYADYFTRLIHLSNILFLGKKEF
jgi:hypothetical protein